MRYSPTAHGSSRRNSGGAGRRPIGSCKVVRLAVGMGQPGPLELAGALPAAARALPDLGWVLVAAARAWV